MSALQFDSVPVVARIGVYSVGVYSSDDQYRSHTLASGHGDAVFVTLPTRQHDEALNFKFKEYGGTSKEEIDVTTMLQKCTDARPRGHQLSDDSKTLIVFYAATTPYDVLAGARTALQGRISQAADELQREFKWDPSRKIITDHNGVPVHGYDLEVHTWSAPRFETIDA